MNKSLFLFSKSLPSFLHSKIEANDLIPSGSFTTSNASVISLSNYIHEKIFDVITHPCSDFNGSYMNE